MTTPLANPEPHDYLHSLISAPPSMPADQATVDAHLTASIHATHLDLSHLYADIPANHRRITSLFTARVLIRPVDPQDEVARAIHVASQRFLAEREIHLAALERPS